LTGYRLVTSLGG